MRGIDFGVVWFDREVIEYTVTCSNGSFCGAAKMYLARDGLWRAADAISGFPQHPEDSRSVRLGALTPNVAGGGMEMSFFCVDSAGHAVVLVKLRADGCKGIGEPESASLYIPVEAGSIDTFVAQARSVEDTKGATAHLHMADHTLGWVQRVFRRK
jgi:hypothetical protein